MSPTGISFSINCRRKSLVWSRNWNNMARQCWMPGERKFHWHVSTQWLGRPQLCPWWRCISRLWRLDNRELKHQTFLVPRTPTGTIFAAWQPLRTSRRSWAAVTDFKTRVLRLKPEVQILGSSKSIRQANHCRLIVCVLHYVIKIMNDIRLLVLRCCCVIGLVFNIFCCKRAVSLYKMR